MEGGDKIEILTQNIGRLYYFFFSVRRPSCRPVYLPLCLFLSLSSSVTLCLPASLSACLSAYLPLCLPLSLSSYVTLCLCLSLCLPLCLPACLIVCLSLSLSASLSVRLHLCLCLSLCLPLCLPVCLSACLSVSFSLSLSLSLLLPSIGGLRVHSVPLIISYTFLPQLLLCLAPSQLSVPSLLLPSILPEAFGFQPGWQFFYVF